MKLVEITPDNQGNQIRNELGFIMSMRFWMKKFTNENDRSIYVTIWVGKHNPSIAGWSQQPTFGIYYTQHIIKSRKSFKSFIIKDGFKTSKSAMEYVNAHLDEILSLEFEEKIK